MPVTSPFKREVIGSSPIRRVAPLVAQLVERLRFPLWFSSAFYTMQARIAIVGYFDTFLQKKRIEQPTDYDFISLAFFIFRKE